MADVSKIFLGKVLNSFHIDISGLELLLSDRLSAERKRNLSKLICLNLRDHKGHKEKDHGGSEMSDMGAHTYVFSLIPDHPSHILVAKALEPL